MPKKTCKTKTKTKTNSNSKAKAKPRPKTVVRRNSNTNHVKITVTNRLGAGGAGGGEGGGGPTIIPFERPYHTLGDSLALQTAVRTHAEMVPAAVVGNSGTPLSSTLLGADAIKPKPEPEIRPKPEQDAADYASMSVSALKSLARDLGFRVRSKDSKSDVLRMLA